MLNRIYYLMTALGFIAYQTAIMTGFATWTALVVGQKPKFVYHKPQADPGLIVNKYDGTQELIGA